MTLKGDRYYTLHPEPLQCSREKLDCEIACHTLTYKNTKQVCQWYKIKALQNNFEGCTRKKLDKSILSHKVQAMVGHTTEEMFKHTVRSKPWNNSSIKVEDFTNAQTIFGPDLASVQGKTVIYKP